MIRHAQAHIGGVVDWIAKAIRQPDGEGVRAHARRLNSQRYLSALHGVLEGQFLLLKSKDAGCHLASRFKSSEEADGKDYKHGKYDLGSNRAAQPARGIAASAQSRSYPYQVDRGYQKQDGNHRDFYDQCSAVWRIERSKLSHLRPRAVHARYYQHDNAEHGGGGEAAHQP